MDVDADAPHLSQFEILLHCPTGLSQDQLTVEASTKYDRVPHPDPQLEQSITQIWEQRLAAQPALFNGTKFRYGGIRVDKTDTAGHPSHVTLRLGLTNYSQFVGTNLNPRWQGFAAAPTTTSALPANMSKAPAVTVDSAMPDMAQSPSEWDVARWQHTASSLGNGAVVETSDEHVIVLQRSGNVGECPHTLVFPGGHPEPKDAGISCFEDVSPGKAEFEMYDSIVREVEEESGVDGKHLSAPLFIGISRRCLHARPTMMFKFKCVLTSEEVIETYHSAVDKFESTSLCAVPKRELWAKAALMPGCHRGGAWLYLNGHVQKCASIS
eukprot:jgi/Chlat1/2612/Chrsp178S02456